MNTRQQDILSILETQGEVTIKTLSERLNVTPMTIHRDLEYLEKNHYLYKKRGAAVFVNKPDRCEEVFYQEEKRTIGRKAAEYIKPGQSILFDNSTTAREAARFLEGIPHLTFYTTNLETAAILSKYPDTILYCSGGYYFPESEGFVGQQAELFLEKIQADVCIVGASGISEKTGITIPYPLHTALQKKILEVSKYKILVADHSKFDKAAMEKVADLEEIDCIITDEKVQKDILDKYKKYAEIILA